MRETTERNRHLALGGAVVCGVVTFIGLWYGYSNWQFALWVLSLVLVVAAFPARAGEPTIPPEPWTRTEWLVLAAIMLVAVFFRFYRLDDLPPGLWVDECFVSTRAAQLVTEKPFLPFSCSPLTWLEEWVQTSNLYLYWLVLIFKTLGFNFWSIKMISAIPGVLGVPALYLFARELAGKRTAMCAGFLYAAGHWNVRLSRWGWDEVAMTTLQIVSFYFLVRGFRRREPRSFVWAGIVMGFCLYTYIASRLALAAALAGLGGYVFLSRDRRRARVGSVAAFALATTLTVAPLSVFYLQHPKLFNVRTSQVNIFSQLSGPEGFAPLLRNIKAHLLMFHVRGDVFPKHDLPESPLLDPVTGVLFIIGFFMSLRRWRSPGYLLCQMWLWIGLLAGILSDNGGNPHAYRTGNVAPVAMALAALPLGQLLSGAMSTQAAPFSRRANPYAVAALIVLAIGLNYENFFVRWANLPALWDDSMTSRGTSVARMIIDDDSDEEVYVSRWVMDTGFGTLMRSPLSGNESRSKNWNPDYWNADTNPPLTTAKGSIRFFCDPDWGLWMRSWYPHARWSERRNMNGEAYAGVVEIPADDLQATKGLYRHVIRDGAGDGSTPFAAKVIGGRAGTWTLFEGYYHQRIPEFVTFAAPNGGLAGAWLNGEHILDAGETVSTETHLDAGLHGLWLLVPGEVDAPPPLMVRRRWIRGTEVPPANLTPERDSAQQGLRGTIYAGKDWTGEPLATVEPALPTVPKNPPPPPYSAKWTGYLRADETGEYRLGVAMDDAGDVSLDGQRIIDNPGSYAETVVQLFAGWHPIEIRYYDTGGGAYLNLLWGRAGEKEVVGDGEWAPRGFLPLPESGLYRVPFAGRGLRARYYANPHFEGEPFVNVVEPWQWLRHHQGEHFSVELDGYWYFPETGRYWVGLNSDDGSWLELDGELVVDNGGVHGFSADGTGKEIEVQRGLHRLRVRYFQDIAGAGLQLLWAPAGQRRHPVPTVFLYPPPEAETRSGQIARQ